MSFKFCLLDDFASVLLLALVPGLLTDDYMKLLNVGFVFTKFTAKNLVLGCISVLSVFWLSYLRLCAFPKGILLI